MLIKRDMLDQVAKGEVKLVFRRWSRPSVKTGATLKTPAGLLAVDKVTKTALSAIKVKDAQNAGFPTRAALIKALGEKDGDVYRVEFHRVGPDPRATPREDGKLTKKELKSIVAELNRIDQASSRPWTRQVLLLVDKYPARRPHDLAATLGRDPLVFDRDVRKLKDLGLTEALEIGYRLSPRGRTVLNEIAPRSATPADARVVRPPLRSRASVFAFPSHGAAPHRAPGSGTNR